MITKVKIPGATTVHAMRAIETALTMVPGIMMYEVVRGLAIVTHDGRATEEALRDAIAVAGFEVEEIEVDSRRLL